MLAILRCPGAWRAETLPVTQPPFDTPASDDHRFARAWPALRSVGLASSNPDSPLSSRSSRPSQVCSVHWMTVVFLSSDRSVRMPIVEKISEIIHGTSRSVCTGTPASCPIAHAPSIRIVDSLGLLPCAARLLSLPNFDTLYQNEGSTLLASLPT